MRDEQEPYIPLAQQQNRDVMHDNFVPEYHELFVPKYSALAGAQPNRLILTGVWLIFVPMILVAFAGGIGTLASAPDLASAVLFGLLSAAFVTICSAILYTQTRRYIRRRAIISERNASDVT